MVWFPRQHWARIADRVAALKEPSALVGLPTSGFPGVLELDGTDPCWRLNMGRGWFDGLVGCSVDAHVLARPGWTPEALKAFLEMRDEYAVRGTGGQIQLTAAALATWLQAPLLAERRDDVGIELSFVQADGTVVAAELQDGDAAPLRQQFFTDGLSADLVRRPELLFDESEVSPLPRDLGGELRERAKAVQLAVTDFQDWAGQDASAVPYRAALGPQDLVLTDPDEVDQQHPGLVSAELPDGRRVELLADRDASPFHVRCEVDGAEQAHTDPVTGLVASSVIVEDWVDWILEQSVPDRRETERPWTGTDVSAVLTRAERNIVAYHEQQIAPSGFSTGAELQDWIHEVLEPTTIRPKVSVLDDIGCAMAITEPGFVRRHSRRPGDAEEEPTRFHPVKFHPWLPRDDWYVAFAHATRATPSVAVRTDGARVEGFLSEFSLTPEMVEGHRLPPSTPIHDESWVLVEIPDVTGILAFPVGDTLLQVGWDADGADSFLVAHHLNSRIFHLDRRRMFRRRWGRWLDSEVELSAEELSKGLRAIEAMTAEED